MGKPQVWIALQERERSTPERPHGCRCIASVSLEGNRSARKRYEAEPAPRFFYKCSTSRALLHALYDVGVWQGAAGARSPRQALRPAPGLLLYRAGPTTNTSTSTRFIGWRGVSTPLRRHPYRDLADRQFLTASAPTPPTKSTTITTIIHLHRRLRRYGAGQSQIPLGVEADKRHARRRSRSSRISIARFSAGTRASQVSRAEGSRALRTTELARSNIQRPYIKLR